MSHPMFDNSYDPSVLVGHMTLKQLIELNKSNPSKVIDYGKLRCNETVQFLSTTKAYNLKSYGYDHIFIECLRNGVDDLIWLGQFTSKDWDGCLIYPQILGTDHLQRVQFLSNKTLVTDTSVSAYKNYWDGCIYKYASIISIV